MDKPEERVVRITHGRCKDRMDHYGPFMVDPDLAEVECKACGKLLSPIAVLIIFSRLDCRRSEQIDRETQKLRDLQAAILFKNRVKCQHCSRYTPVTKLKEGF